MHTRKMRRMIERGVFYIYTDQRGPHTFPVFRSKHFKARQLRQRTWENT